MMVTGRAGYALALMACSQRWVMAQDFRRRDQMLWEMANIKKCWRGLGFRA